MNTAKRLMAALLLLICMEGFGQSHPAIGYSNTTPDGAWCLTTTCQGYDRQPSEFYLFLV